MNNVEAIRAIHEDYIKYECAIHGGTGDNLLYCDGTRAGRGEFAEWIIDGFPALLDELDAVKAERDHYKQLEADGRLHISPVADGTTVFYIEVGGPFTNRDYNTVQPASYSHGLTERTYGKLNEKWWLTREEAEQVLQS